MEKLLTRMTRFALVSVLTACSCLISACQDDGMVIAEEIPADPGPSGSMAREPTLTAAQQTELEKVAVRSLLQDSCGGCHGQSATRPPHSLGGTPPRYGSDPILDIGDFDELVASGLIKPGLPEESPLLFLVASGQMPPRSSGVPPMSAENVRRLEKFIVRLDPPTRGEFERILDRNCSSCHHSDRGQAVLPINDILDIGVLVAAGLIVPGDRDRSQLYTLVLDGEMPPQGSDVPQVSNYDLARLGGYIDMMQ
jgi:mono/diheme cytochrome c family protein